MAKKSFEIQGSKLRIGGLDLEAGITSVVIPGVTQATSYSVDEVDDNGADQELTFETTPIVIDSVIFNEYRDNGSSTGRAEYAVELEDDGYIDDIDVVDGGTYSEQDYNDIESAPSLKAYTGTEVDPFSTFVTDDWTSIPFRVKMRAGDVENVGGGNADTGDITFEGNKIIGAGEDSGDGNGNDTIRLVPDADLEENDQYIVIDPTVPNHIHIRAGGTQDSSNALLFLGGEKNHVVVEDNNGVTISNEQTFDSYNYYSAGNDFTNFTWFEESGNYFVQFTTVTAPMVSDFWNFANGSPNALSVYDGQGTYMLTYGGVADNLVADVYKVQVVEAPIVDFVANSLEFQIFTTNTNEMYLRNNDFRVDVKDDVRIYSSDIFRLVNRSVEEAIEIITNDNESSNTWYFAADGNMFLPRNSFNADGAYLKTPNGDTNVKLSLNGGNGVEIIADVYGSATSTWQFGTDGNLTFPSNPSLTIAPDSNLIINSGRYPSLTEFCAISNGAEFVADIEFNDDITVVQMGWTVTIDGTPYAVTSIDPFPPANQYRITAAGANFIQGFPYTFVSPTLETSTWQFSNDGTITTPGLGSISHTNNDLKIEVSGTDVIVLRTNGGDLIVNSDGSLSFHRGGTIRAATAPAASTGVVGDKQGDVAFDGSYMYYCFADFPTTYDTALYGGYSGNAFPSIAKGDYPQPLTGWTFVWNNVTYTLVANAIDPNAGQWALHVDQTIDTSSGGTITLTPPGGSIWKRVAWSNDTW